MTPPLRILLIWLLFLNGQMVGTADDKSEVDTNFTSEPATFAGSSAIREDAGTTPAAEDETEKPKPIFNMKEFEKTSKGLINTLMKQLMPMMLKAQSEADISAQCTSSLLKVVVGLRQMKTWAVKMADFTGKIPVGVLSGTLSQLGSFDQCLNIEVSKRNGKEDFRGQYCTLQMWPELPPRPRGASIGRLYRGTHDESVMKLLNHKFVALYIVKMRLGLCLPSTCSKEDVNKLMTQALLSYQFNSNILRCHKKEPIKVEPVQIGLLFPVSALVLILLCATVMKLMNKDGKTFSGKMSSFLMSLSIVNSFKKLANTKSQSNDIPAIHGIRALSMTWIILLHTYLWYPHVGGQSTDTYVNWLNNMSFQTITNGWIAVDSFIFISGFLKSYTMLNYLEKTNGQVNIFSFIFRRYLKLTPLLAFVMIVMFYLPWISDGPFWQDLFGAELNNCYKNWWANLLYINNWFPVRDICLHPTWYLGCDFQLHILSFVFIVLLYRKPWLGLCVTALVGISCNIFTAVISYANDYPPVAATFSLPDKELIFRIYKDIYIRTYNHVAPYAVGIVLGFLLVKEKNFKLSLKFQMTGWIVATVFAFCSLYGSFEWCRGNYGDSITTALYNSTHRTVWSLALSWLTFVCVTGQGGIINSLLSMKYLVPISKVSFSAYLLQGIVILVRYGSIKTGLYYSQYNFVYEYFGHLVTTLGFSFILCIMVEMPFAELDKFIFASKSQKAKEEECEEYKVKSTQESTAPTEKSKGILNRLENFKSTFILTSDENVKAKVPKSEKTEVPKSGKTEVPQSGKTEVPKSEKDEQQECEESQSPKGSEVEETKQESINISIDQ